jgi:hypothetical protein
MGPDNPQLSPRIATTTRSVTPTLHCKFAGAFAGLAEGEKAKHAGTRWPRFCRSRLTWRPSRAVNRDPRKVRRTGKPPLNRRAGNLS